MSAPGNKRRTTTRDDWATPLELFNPLDMEFNFRLDVCADEKSAKVDRFLSGPCRLEEGDRCICGLCAWWADRCWMNPPFSGVTIWIAKAVHEAQRRCLVVALLPVATSTVWWGELLVPFAHEIRLLKGRVPFIHPQDCDCNACRDGKKGSNTTDSAVAIFRPGPPPKKGAHIYMWDWRAE